MLEKTGHYSPNVRKETLLGLKNLFDQSPVLLTRPSTLMQLFDKIVLRMCDPAGPVRIALHALLRTVCTPIHAANLAPFFPLLIVHTCSAMTKLDGEVRADSLLFLGK